MFEIDDNLLNELGLGALAGQEREEFKDYVKTTLQERVGEKLTAGMPDEVLDEFGYFMDGNVAGMKKWLWANTCQITRAILIYRLSARPTQTLAKRIS